MVQYSTPSEEPYIDQTGIAYWQWADSYMTRFKSDPATDSVAGASDTVTGYVEFWYWMN